MAKHDGAASANATDFTKQNLQQRLAWAKAIWEVARTRSFAMQFMGTGPNSVLQRITELTQVKGAAKAVIQLVADLEYDGISGDNILEGREEALRAFEQIVRYDMLRTATRNKGLLSDKKSTIDFRNQSKDKLGYFFANRIDQLIFLTLAGLDYSLKNDGSLRPSDGGVARIEGDHDYDQKARSAFLDLEFRDDVKEPTVGRHLQVSGDTIVLSDPASLTADDRLTYAALVRAKAYAKETGLRGIRQGNDELYHVIVTPQGLADLRLDPEFLENVRAAGVRGDKNSLFSGASSVLIDGMVVHEYRLCPTNRKDTTGWGAADDVTAQYCLILGAQALGFVDFGAPGWTEKTFDYGNNHGIATNKIFGMLKPQFENDWMDGNKEDYGVIRLDAAMTPLATVAVDPEPEV